MVVLLLVRVEGKRRSGDLRLRVAAYL